MATKKKYYKKRSNYKPRKKYTSKNSYSPSQKKSWLAGFMAGLRSKKKRKSERSAKHKSAEWILADRYAKHTVRKFSLPSSEMNIIRENAYKEARSNVGFFNDLFDNYGSVLNN